MVRLEYFDGNNIIDVILPKYVGELITNVLLCIIQIYHLIECINKLVWNVRNIIYDIYPSGIKYNMRVSLYIEGEKLESSNPLLFVRNRNTQRKMTLTTTL